MPKSSHTEEQFVAVMRQVQAGARVDNILPQGGDQPSDVLSLEATIFRSGGERTAAAA